MRNGAPLVLGAGRYVQGPGLLATIAKEVSYLGTKAVILAEELPWDTFKDTITSSLEDASIPYIVFPFSGYCSDSVTSKLAEAVKQEAADLVIGVGGGKAMDAAKWGAYQAGVQVLNVPTTVTTCAASVTLCVLYDDDGAMNRVEFTDRAVGCVLIDTDLIVNQCPARHFAAGIADALAKEPEMYFSERFAQNWEDSVLPTAGALVSQFTASEYFSYGLQALEDLKAGKVTDAVDDVVALNVVMTGLVSSFASGGKQLALAHSLYDCTTILFKPQRAKYLHGEIVSCGIPIQLAVNGYDEQRIKSVIEFLKKLGTPTKLSDIEIKPTEENIETILNYMFTTMDIRDTAMQDRIREGIRLISH